MYPYPLSCLDYASIYCEWIGQIANGWTKLRMDRPNCEWIGQIGADSRKLLQKLGTVARKRASGELDPFHPGHPGHPGPDEVVAASAAPTLPDTRRGPRLR